MQRLIVSTIDGLSKKFGEDYLHRLDSEKKYPSAFVAEMGRLGMAALRYPRSSAAQGTA